MYEVRFHGRGGQGAVTAARLLADAAFREGKDVQSFPIFGVERRGAPVAAFTRMDDKPIDIKTQIYEPDVVIVLDPTLIGVIDVADGLKDNGKIVINSKKKPADFKLGDTQVYTITDIVEAEYDYLSPQKISVEKKEMNTVVKQGDFYVTCAQEGANLIPCLLEPESEYGLIRYWKYHLVPDKGDVYPFYRIIKGQELPLVPFMPWKN